MKLRPRRPKNPSTGAPKGPGARAASGRPEPLRSGGTTGVLGEREGHSLGRSGGEASQTERENKEGEQGRTAGLMWLVF